MNTNTETLRKNVWESFSAPMLSGLTDAEVDALEKDCGVNFFWNKEEDGTNTLRVLGFINGFLKDKHVLLEGRFCDTEQEVLDFTVLIDHAGGDSAICGETVGIGFKSDPACAKIRLTAPEGRMVKQGEIPKPRGEF